MENENEMTPQDTNGNESLEDSPFEPVQENTNNNNMNNGNSIVQPEPSLSPGLPYMLPNAALPNGSEHMDLSNSHVVLPEQNSMLVDLTSMDDCMDNMPADVGAQAGNSQHLPMVLASSDVTPYGHCANNSYSHHSNSHFHKNGYELDTIKTGDVEKERMIEERVKELGLWNNKRILEQQLYQRLAANIDEDGLFQAINKCKRKRPLRERVDSTRNEVINTVQPKLVKDDFGNKVAYKVSIIMGLFTHNVRHKIQDHSVVIQGSTPDNRASKLYKEVTIEFPHNVDISLLEVSFNAGVFKCEAPFKVRNLNRLSKSFDSVSSYQSEETESVTSSDLKSMDGVS